MDSIVHCARIPQIGIIPFPAIRNELTTDLEGARAAINLGAAYLKQAADEPKKAVEAVDGKHDPHSDWQTLDVWRYRAGWVRKASEDTEQAITRAQKHIGIAVDSIGDAINRLANYEWIDGEQVLHLAFTEPQWEAFCEGARIVENLGAFDLPREGQVETMARLINHVPLDVLQRAYRDAVMEMTDEAQVRTGDTELDDEAEDANKADSLPAA
jgi:hypothetical protein